MSNRLRIFTKATPGANGTIEFIGSTEDKDRAGDIVRMAGCDPSNYLRNPVVLYAHDYASLPIGKCLSVRAAADGIHFTVQFAGGDIYPFAETVRAMYEGGFLSAVSIGFRCITSTNIEGGGFGQDITEWELLELSCCPVPMNAHALVAGKSAGKKIAPIFGEAGKWPTLDIVTRGADQARIAEWFAPKSITVQAAAKKGIIMVTKAETPPAAPAEGEVDLKAVAAAIKQAVADLTPGADGSLDAAKHSGAIAALNKAAADCEKAAGGEAPAEDAPAEDAPPPPPMKAMEERIDALVTRLKAISDAIGITDNDEPSGGDDLTALEKALADPAICAQLITEMQTA